MSDWTVPANVLEVHDGDTLKADLDLGRHSTHRSKPLDLGWHIRIDEWGHIRLTQLVRIDGINAPELATPEGRAALEFADTLVKTGDAVTVVSKKLLGSTEKYGRILADVTLPSGQDFAQVMLANGHAQPWDGKGPKP